PCSNDTRNWAHQTANNLRLDIADYSCNGTTYNLDIYVNDAIKTGNIGPDTKEVVLMYGGLQPDTYVDTLANATLPNIPKGSN
ncbi:esterase, partial [Mycobacterium tuberculosis]|nr:esterase [Mycobacterium tuberculosis]